jgi:hypothetical protein
MLRASVGIISNEEEMNEIDMMIEKSGKRLEERVMKEGQRSVVT